MPSSTPPQLDNVAVSIDSSAIAIIKYNRPKAANALNVAVLKDVLSALQWAEAADNVRVIVTTGEGKFYTAGLDLLDKSNQQEGATINDEFIGILGKIHEAIINTNKLVVSAVNGPAPGWGTSSIALSDLVYAAPDAFFFTPFAQWGLCAEGCSSLTFTRIMGRQKASALILGGARMTAAELESAGLVTKILPKENFLEEVLKIARGIVKLPKESLKTNKELMMRNLRGELLETNRMELELLRKQARTQESLGAIAGFAAETERKKKEKAGSKL
ncbi:hypothetical protein M409DRAFT_22584 [Zasmidium cellare ATCC 36951]|uniref:Uncharacterized protein n=1 Tax=Zasmidium cellare ATCC 36951 TaxID=1080233 RepID=A0A6A6CJ35_ZASCE|nr:uncharacterized protein M409DRAFT_22584 [Zasmidium cellare ATCC 36951]KAF2167155.1 hypothetical protein M409DRAFT_22584 [Zasmidium cellare ATCC 36951]